MEGLERLRAGKTAALKAHRKPLLWPWPWGACSGSGLGPGVPAGDGVWRVWRVLEGLESFGMFGAFAGWQTAALKPIESHCCGLGPGVPVGEVALALGCLLGGVFGGFGWRVWKVSRILEGLERLQAGKRQLCKPIESHCCGLGPGVPVREVALALGCLLGKVFGGFGAFWRVWKVWSVCRLANGSFESL